VGGKDRRVKRPGLENNFTNLFQLVREMLKKIYFYFLAAGYRIFVPGLGAETVPYPHPWK